MPIYHGKLGRRLTAVSAVLLGVLGVTAVPAAQASRPGHLDWVRPGAGLGAFPSLRPGAFASLRASAAVPASLRPGGSGLWRPGALAAGAGLPRAPRSAAGSGSTAGAGSAASGGTARGRWSVVPSHGPARLRNGSLAAVSCPGRAACTAVGSYTDRAGVTMPLAQRWDGSAWRPQPIGAPAGAIYTVLNGVSCASAAACTAVGYYFTGADQVRTLAEAWDGARWMIDPSAGQVGVASGLFAVSCTAASACTAVGVYDNSEGVSLALAERWDGSGWSVQPTPFGVTAVPSELLGVSCTGPAACAAVGATDDPSGTSVPLALTWDGLIWHGGPAPAPAASVGSGLSAVACSAASACTAVGSYDTASGSEAVLAERWNGSGWTLQHVPVPHGTAASTLLGVSCPAAAACVAVGAYEGPSPAGAAGAGVPAGGSSGAQVVRPFAAGWDGSRWRGLAAASAPGARSGGLSAVACAAASSCSAVGSFARAASLANLSLAESWNGAAWRIRPAVSPPGANDAEFAADSCLSARSCVAVGFYARSAGVADTLAEVWDGSGWHIVPTPNPRGAAFSDLESVSCSSARACMAVGVADGKLGRSAPLAERWDGTRWTIVPVPVPAGGSGAALYGVSCASRRACTAVGFYGDRAKRTTALAERWDGTGWSVQPLPRAAKMTWLFGVSCPTVRFCEAAGYLNKGTGDADPMAQGWNGTKWSVQPVPRPAGSPGGAFDAVSCSSPRACAATGASFSSNGAPLGERWNGTRWHPRPAAAPPNYQVSFSEVTMNAVSCPAARSCTALGAYTPGNEAEAFAEAWHGAGWDLEFTAVPRGAGDVLLAGVACTGRGCLAVGASIGPSGTIVPLAEAKAG